MKANLTYISLLMTGMFLLTSCMRDEVDGPRPQQDLRVTFSLQLPKSYAAAPATGLAQDEERMISDLAVLLFVDQPSGDPKCIHKIENLHPTPVSGTDNGFYPVTTPMPQGKYRIMLLANVPPRIHRRHFDRCLAVRHPKCPGLRHAGQVESFDP